MRYDELSEAERDRLRAAFDAGYSSGSCWPSLVPDDLVDLVQAVQDDWFRSLETMQESQRARYAFPDIEWLRAAAERESALGDARPPEGWLTRAGKDGRP